MKYYDTNYDEYMISKHHYNLHPVFDSLIQKISHEKMFGNFILYGPSGIGKYSQALYLIKKITGSSLKYEKKVIINTEKQDYICKISDLHYEVDLGLLGCHSKILFHETFQQIIEIITLKPNPLGFILLKNFHCIHSELLELFYSYMQQYSGTNSFINLYFIILTENVSFMPNNVLSSSITFNMTRPTSNDYSLTWKIINDASMDKSEDIFISRIASTNSGENNVSVYESIKYIIDDTGSNNIMNCKEINHLKMIKKSSTPDDVFNVICDKLIENMVKPEPCLSTIRECIYDIFTYNVEPCECIWYILHFLIDNNYIDSSNISKIMSKCNGTFKYFNNNYRPIYHIENIILFIVVNIKDKQ